MRADFAGRHGAGRFRRLHGCSAKTSPANATRAAPRQASSRRAASITQFHLVWSLCHNSPRQGRASPRRKDKDLAWINQVGIADLLPVRLVNYGVARAVAVGEAADAPEAVAAGDGGGRDLRH